ncbi:MAG: ATP-binding protein, partial [Lachnospiraceae bacterium]|nr:ATP-binding protein [Lachnospiraceae bacterium]
MLADEIKAGESTNIEFKVEVPKKSERYIKSVIAFANTAGGKIIIGVDDETHEIVGVNKDEVFKIMDSITNTISDMCYPQIFPNIGVDTIDGKCVIVIEIYPGASRPYYIKSLGKESGTYIRVSGTSRLADEAILKDLELQGTNHSFDEMICVEQKYDALLAERLCAAIKSYMVEAVKTKSEKEKVKDVTIQNLINWGIVKNLDGVLVPTNAFVLLTNNTFPFAKIQCALFKGIERVIFIDKRDFEGPLYEQIEEAYEFVLKHINLGAEINGLVRMDTYELPTEAIREAIVNAMTHRNFLDRSCVQVAVYDDRVEITSPGMLYG